MLCCLNITPAVVQPIVCSDNARPPQYARNVRIPSWTNGRSCQMQLVFGSAGNIETCAWRSPSLGRPAVRLEFVISIYTGR